MGSVPETVVGQRIDCPKCKEPFEVPVSISPIFDELESLAGVPPRSSESPRSKSIKPGAMSGRNLTVLLTVLGVVGLLISVTYDSSPQVAKATSDLPQPAPAPSKLAELPKDGWAFSRVVVFSPVGKNSTVCLQSAAEPNENPAFISFDGCRSLLAREIVRQAFLIAARDGLGLSTRDGTIGDPDEPPGGRLVAEVGSSLLPGRSVLTLKLGQAAPTRLLDEELPRRYVNHLWLLDKVEPFSRGKYAEILKDLGVVGSPKPPRTETAEDPAIEANLACLSVFGQLAAIRAIHEEMRQGGESPQLLGELVRGYGILSLLTDRFWHPSHQAYMARSLLYAQRLRALDQKSPRGLWHKACAEALAGYPKAALDDIAEGDRLASAMKKDNSGAVPTRPGWVRLIVAYCENRAEDLVVPGIDPQAPLASLLGFLSIEDTSADALIIGTGRVALEANPECTRINDVICDRGGVSVNHWSSELGLATLTKAIPARLRAIPKLPAAAEVALGQSDEASLIRAMITAAAPGEDSGEPSWAALGMMVRETRFVQVWRRLMFLRNMLGVPRDEFLQEARPLIAVHPYRNYLESYAFEQNLNRDEIAELLRTLDIQDPEEPAFPMIEEIFMKDNVRMNKLFKQLTAHYDYTARDMTRRSLSKAYLHGDPQPVDLLKLSPDSPSALARLIRNQWKKAEPQAGEWEKSHSRHPEVLAELAKRYAGLNRPEDSIRCLKAYLLLSPDRWAYEMLANLYLAKGDKVTWKSTLDEALTKPDTNLDHMVYRVTIARQLMREGHWKEAQPYAEDAAESWAAQGIYCAVLCDEGLKDWKGAETWLRRLVERYPGSYWSEWLLWCARTGQGDIQQAEQAAVQVIRQLGSPPPISRIPSVGNYLIWSGKTREALGAHRQYYDQTHDLLYGMSVVVLADQSKDVVLRDAMLASLLNVPKTSEPLPPRLKKGEKPQPQTKTKQPRIMTKMQVAIIYLAEPLKPWLAGTVPIPDLVAVDEAIEPLLPPDQGSIEYFVGCLLKNHGRLDDAALYFGRAARGRETDPWFRVLAIRELRLLGVKLSNDDIAAPIRP
jgi:tetratricopeptide (TPR) repeat protein